MASHQNNPFFDNRASNSFSFDNTSSHDAPRRSIDHYLRLKTNQSLEERPLNSIQLSKNRKKPIRTEESDLDGEHCRRLAMEEHDLRMESLVKQYQLRLSKQEEYYGLKEWKMKQELENLQKQNNSLTEELRRTKINSRHVQKQCPLCNDGQIINQLTKVLKENEQNHKGCISEKKELRSKENQATTKLQVLEQQHQKVCQQLRSISKQIRSFQSKIKQLEQERDQAINLIKQTEKIYQQKLSNAETESKSRQKQLDQLNIALNQSKATVQSTQSVFTNARQSMKSSYVKIQDPNTQQFIKSSYRYSQDPRQQKQNRMVQDRKSQSKMMPMSSEDYQELKNGNYPKKMSENIYKNGFPQRYEPRRKYF